MQRLKVDAYEVALIYKMGALEQVLTKGKYWIGWGRRVQKLSTLISIPSAVNLDIVLQHEDFRALVDVVEIKDNEIGFRYKNERFYQLLETGRYAFWKGLNDFSYNIYDKNELEVPTNIARQVLRNRRVITHVRVHVVDSYEKGLLFVDGNFVKVLDAGTYFYWNNGQAIILQKVDLRKQMLEVPGQELLTKDKAAIRMSFFVHFQVIDLMKALVDTKDFVKQLYIQLQLALRAYIGTQTLDNLLANKEDIAPFVVDSVKKSASEMGVQILSAGIRDVILPGDVKEIMNQVLIAEKKAQANVIMRREETASTRSLMNTAKLMEDNAMLYRLKEMEFIEKIADNVQNISLNNGGAVIDDLRGLFGAKQE